MHENEILDNLKISMESLEKTTTWGILLLFATLIAALFTTNSIVISGINIPKNISGIVTFGILCSLNFKVFHLLQNIKSLLKIIEPKTEIAHMKIRFHPWVLNPFSETQGRLSLFSDNFGYALLLLFWWTGAQTGFFLIRTGVQDPKLKTIGIILFFVYLCLGLMSMFLISDLISTVCKEKVSIRLKMFLTFIAIPIGSFGLKHLFF